MKPFEFEHAAASVDDRHPSRPPAAKYYAGGTNLLDLMKGGVEQPSALVDIGRLGLTRDHRHRVRRGADRGRRHQQRASPTTH